MSDYTDKFEKWIVNIDVEDWFKRMSEYALLVETKGSDKALSPENFMEEYFIDNVLGQDDNSDRLYEEWRDMQMEETANKE